MLESGFRACVHRYGDLEAVEDFLAVGKDANMRDSEGRTPLFIAVAYNHAPIVEELLRAGADVHAQARTRAWAAPGRQKADVSVS